MSPVASLGPRPRVVVLGTGGLGGALADVAEAGGAEVVRLGRPLIDAHQPERLAQAAQTAGEGLAAVIVATGLLHRPGQGPERDWRQLEPDWMLENFRVNAMLPALAAAHFLPRLRDDGKAVFAVLSARVGSIADNRLGGWHSYRASKAALNQYVRSLSVELRRKRPQAIAVALHPGTVDTPMSQPFQRNVPAERLFAPRRAAEALWRVVDALGPADSGGFRAWDGQVIAW